MKQRMLLKIGGRAFSHDAGLSELAQAIREMSNVQIIIIHGGGAQISKALQDAEQESEFIDGMRVTRQEDIEIVERVLSGKVNAHIVQILEKDGVTCERLSGKSNGLIIAEKITRNGRDIGFVGRVVKVQPEAIITSLQHGNVPVISPVSADKTGTTFNINADTAAAALAASTHCTDLIYFSDVAGVLIENRIVRNLSVQKALELIANGTIHSGMVAKMESIFDALQKGVERVHIARWNGPHTLRQISQDQDIEKTTIYQ